MRRDTPRLVLLVEDVESCSVALEIALLAIDGVAVETAPTAEEALQRLTADSVRAVVTDLHLPGMDGFELIERIRCEPRLKRLPVVVVSGDADPRTPQRVLRLGADAFFGKPYSPVAVRHKVEELLNA